MNFKVTDQNVTRTKDNRQWSVLPVALFQTQQSYFAFDFKKINFLEVDEIVYKTLSLLQAKKQGLDELAAGLPEYSVEEVREALNDIAEIQEQGFLTPNRFERANPHPMEKIKKYLSSAMQGLHMNVTSGCNLACDYCIFGGSYENVEHLENRHMSMEVADKAVAFFKARARKEGALRVDFFGGEPMLQFPIIKHVVSELKPWAQARNQKLNTTISSNGTVMNEKISDFLVENDVFFQISMDGEKEIHDAKRRFKNKDTGSFDTIMRSLQIVYDRDLEYFKTHIKLKAVLTTNALYTDGAEFFNIDLIKILHEHDSFSVINQSPYYNVQKDDDFFSRIHLLGKILLEKRDVSTINELLEGLDYKKKVLFNTTLGEFFTIQVHHILSFDENDAVPFKKNCLLGAEACVNVGGDISICYNANTFEIGNVIENKWYFDKIEEFHNARYARVDRCKHCFVQRFCGLCYEKLTTKENGFDQSYRNYCEFNREFHRVVFQYMLQIVENNPGLWDELQHLAEKENKIRRKRAKAAENTADQ